MAAAKSEIIKGLLRSQHGNGIRSVIGLFRVKLMKDKKGAETGLGRDTLQIEMQSLCSGAKTAIRRVSRWAEMASPWTSFVLSHWLGLPEKSLPSAPKLRWILKTL